MTDISKVMITLVPAKRKSFKIIGASLGKNNKI
jgi:hypothetical protein